MSAEGYNILLREYGYRMDGRSLISVGIRPFTSDRIIGPFRDAMDAATYLCPVVRDDEFTERLIRLQTPSDERDCHEASGETIPKLPAVLDPCFRSACREPHATWYNSSTREWYCRPCALMINEHNPGLCVEGAA